METGASEPRRSVEQAVSRADGAPFVDQDSEHHCRACAGESAGLSLTSSAVSTAGTTPSDLEAPHRSLPTDPVTWCSVALHPPRPGVAAPDSCCAPGFAQRSHNRQEVEATVCPLRG